MLAASNAVLARNTIAACVWLQKSPRPNSPTRAIAPQLFPKRVPGGRASTFFCDAWNPSGAWVWLHITAESNLRQARSRLNFLLRTCFKHRAPCLLEIPPPLVFGGKKRPRPNSPTRATAPQLFPKEFREVAPQLFLVMRGIPLARGFGCTKRPKVVFDKRDHASTFWRGRARARARVRPNNHTPETSLASLTKGPGLGDPP